MNYLFDLFGTLIKLPSGFERIIGGVFREEEGFYREHIREFLSRKDFSSQREALDSLARHLKIKLEESKKGEFFFDLKKWNNNADLYPYVEEVLENLKKRGSKLGVISNNNKFIQTQIERLGLGEYFDFIILSHQVGFMKPQKEIYELALEKLCCAAEEVTMIGDQYAKDVEGPMKMGIHGVLFDPEGKEENRNYEVKKIASLRELLY